MHVKLDFGGGILLQDLRRLLQKWVEFGLGCSSFDNICCTIGAQYLLEVASCLLFLCFGFYLQIVFANFYYGFADLGPSDAASASSMEEDEKSSARMAEVS